MLPRPGGRRSVAERTLVLLRHAKSDWSGCEPDIERPLAERGRRQASDAGRWLRANVGHIDLAVVSPARRARSTWDLVASELDEPPRGQVDERTYAASAAGLLTVVRGLDDDSKTVVLVGHNPGLENLLRVLTGGQARMPTSALAVISWSGSWSTAGQCPAALRASGRPPR
jgi:phosphohistidine phosphatase